MGDPTSSGLDRSAYERAIENPEQRSRVDALGRCIAGRLALCSEDELRVIDDLLGRLEKGRDAYGYLDLSRDNRDWAREEMEEQLDAALYRSFARVRRQNDIRDRLACEAADEIANTPAGRVDTGLRELVEKTGSHCSTCGVRWGKCGHAKPATEATEG